MTKLFQYVNYIDYDELINKPLINHVVVEGDKTLADYGIQPAGNYAHLNASGKVPFEELDDSILGNLQYQGTWDAEHNNPNLPLVPSKKGQYWIVSHGGERFELEFETGDWIIAGDGVWQKIDNTDTIISINGKKGVVVLNAEDIPYGSSNVKEALDSKQHTLTAGKNIKIENNVISAEFTEAILDYNLLYHHPSINGVELINNKTLEDLDIQKTIYAGQNVYLTKSDAQKMDDTINVYEATESRKGVSEIATQNEVNEGADDFRYITPKKLKPIRDALEQKIAAEEARAKGVEGRLSSLTTDAKNNLVSAINEVDTHTDTNTTNIGTLSSLTTDAKDNLVSAINEVDLHSDSTSSDLADEIARATGVEGSLSNLTTDTKTNLVSAINEVDSHSDTNSTNLSNHIGNTSNPHSVTKAQVGLGNVDNTSDLDKPISTATQTALDGKVDKVTTPSRVYGTDASGNQITYDYDSFGKVDDVKVDGTSVVTNKIANLGSMASESTANYYKKTDLANIATSGSWNDLSNTPTTLSGYGITDAYTKTEVDGLISSTFHYKGSVNTYADLPSSEQQVGDVWNVATADTTHGIKAGDNVCWDGNNWDVLSGVVDLSVYDNHIANKNNPHQVTKEQVGLGNVDNTSDLDKPISTATQEALQNEINRAIDRETALNTNIQDEITRSTNKDQELENNKADKSTVYTKTEIDNMLTGAMHFKGSLATLADLENIQNPSVGDMYNVEENGANYAWDGTTWIKMSETVDLSDYALTSYVDSKDLEEKTARENADALKVDKVTTPSRVYGTDELGQPITYGVSLFGKIDDVTVGGVSVVTNRVAVLGTMASETAADYSTKAIADTLYADKTTTDNHITNTNNPHSVTKEQVGLGNVDNTSDLDKPISTATQEALDGKLDKVTTSKKVYGTDDSGNQTTYDYDSFGKVDDVKVGGASVVTDKIANLGTMASETAADYSTKAIADTLYADKTTTDNHITNTNNPHSVTKEQVGLGNVDNTSDLDKPISTATQEALDGKQDVLTQQQINATNSGIDSSKVEIYDGYAALINEKADYSTVASLSSTVSQNTSNIALKANSSDVYTKAEVDGKVSSSMHFKGTVASIENLPSENQEIGDMYNVLSNGANYAWDGSNWDELSETIDLSVYYTKTEISGLLTPINSSISNLESSKQNVLTQGSNITISNNTISAVVPTKVSDLTNDSGYITSSSLPIVNNATLTIQKNGTNIQTFTSNASENVTANITVPTTVAELTDSSNYALESSLSNYALNNSVIHKTGNEEINGEKIFNEGVIAKRDTSGPIVKATSEQGDTYLLVERTITGSNPIQTVIENGLTDTKIGTKSNNSVKIITNDVTQMTLGTDGSVILATDVEANSNNNQVATTKWTTNALSNKANSSEVYTKTEIDAKLENVSADESNLVHKSGDEEITGLKTISLTTTPITSLNIDTNEIYNEENYIATSEIKVNDKVIKTQYSNTFEPEVIPGLKFPVQLEKIHNEYSMDTMLAKGDISHFESANEMPLSFTKLSFEGVDTTSDTKIFDINTEIRIIPEEYKVDVTDVNSNVKSGIELGLATKHLLLTGDAAKFDINTNKDAVPTIKYVEELVPTKTSQLTNDSGYLTEHQDISGKADKSDTYTKSEIDAKFQYVTQLPENPQEGVIYFILEE